ncbi:MAG TPA: hypothetical protein VHT91_39455, partial [Kofleriaceae bacterium]|nr:hypothetical protein [Kofleriaceae bacterium]
VTFTAYCHLLVRTRTAVATSYAYVNPVLAVALGVLVGGEHLRAGAAIAGVDLVAGHSTRSAPRRRRQRRPPTIATRARRAITAARPRAVPGRSRRRRPGHARDHLAAARDQARRPRPPRPRGRRRDHPMNHAVSR